MSVELSDDGGHRLNQEKAIGDLMRSNGLTDDYSSLTPIGKHVKDERPSDAELLGSVNAPPGPTVHELQSLVNLLLWVARCTRPDNAFAVHMATRQTHAPRVLNWSLEKRIARYLKKSATLKTTIKAFPR
uniref:Uncharacterized protein n=1 Tax=Peronospora matthiolae TaxID=2874970 RepID=A0AAV1T712_9STRA